MKAQANSFPATPTLIDEMNPFNIKVVSPAYMWMCIIRVAVYDDHRHQD